MVTQTISRRRFLCVCATAGAYAAMPWTGVLASAPLHHWNGILLGAHVSLTLAHPDQNAADSIFETCVGEIKRLENIFTLYDSYSELSQLNAYGRLQAPSPEMIDILQLSRKYHMMTGGAFDVTIKPLEDGQSTDIVGMDKVQISPKEIRLTRPGMAITLNGIAQGYITDRITELLKAQDLNNVLVELGEKRAIGAYPSGRPWRLAVQGQKEPISLIDKALATSATRNPSTGQHHIFDPASGKTSQNQSEISVLAPNAAMADALSTGFLAMDQNRLAAIISTIADIEVLT